MKPEKYKSKVELNPQDYALKHWLNKDGCGVVINHSDGSTAVEFPCEFKTYVRAIELAKLMLYSIRDDYYPDGIAV